MTEVMVLIPTFRRPNGLARLLDALEALDTSAKVSVVVADNDAEGRQGYDLCQARRAAGYRWPLDAIMVADRGIAQNRNALVARALAQPAMQYVAMLDDDEWPHPGWLGGLLRTQAAFDADLVEGRIECVYEDPATADGRYEGVAEQPEDSGPIAMPEATANLLLTRACLEMVPAPQFDRAFALTGGEDRDFFIRLKRAGARFAWSYEALAYAYVPVTRTGLRWMLSRAYGVGNSDMRVFLKHRTDWASLAREVAKLAGAFLAAPVMMLLHAANPVRRLAALRMLSRAAGKTAALLGRRHDEYVLIHGD